MSAEALHGTVYLLRTVNYFVSETMLEYEFECFDPWGHHVYGLVWALWRKRL